MTNLACAPTASNIFTDDKRNKPLTLAKNYVGVIGSRNLPAIYKETVKQIVELLLQKGYAVAFRLRSMSFGGQAGGAIGINSTPPRADRSHGAILRLRRTGGTN